MLVYIFACEGSYGGLHGIYNENVVEVQDMEEANEYGYEMAQSVVESYHCFGFFDEEDEYIEQELEWHIYKIKEGISADEARAAIGSYNEEDFVAKYCEGEMLN